MFKVISHTVIQKENRLAGVRGKTISLVRRTTIGNDGCLSVTVDRNLIAKNFKLDEEWEAESFYTETVKQYKNKYQN